jgi:Putative adhesin Stv domain
MAVRLVVLGHGSFTRESFETLVPPATTLRFFSDAGSKLRPTLQAYDKNTGKKVGEASFNYTDVADVLSQYEETESPLAAGAVVYNMLLGPLHKDEQVIAKELEKAGKWQGEMLLNPNSDKWKLCEGDATTCPTPKLHVA